MITLNYQCAGCGAVLTVERNIINVTPERSYHCDGCAVPGDVPLGLWYTLHENPKHAMRDKAVHYEYDASLTACGRGVNYRLVTVEPHTLTCKKCRRILAEHPGWRRHYRNW